MTGLDLTDFPVATLVQDTLFVTMAPSGLVAAILPKCNVCLCSVAASDIWICHPEELQCRQQIPGRTVCVLEVTEAPRPQGQPVFGFTRGGADQVHGREKAVMLWRRCLYEMHLSKCESISENYSGAKSSRHVLWPRV